MLAPFPGGQVGVLPLPVLGAPCSQSSMQRCVESAQKAQVTPAWTEKPFKGSGVPRGDSQVPSQGG